MKKIPLTTYPNQTFKVNITVNEKNMYVEISLSYNNIGKYWMMSIKDVKNNKLLISNINLLTTMGENFNFLKPYKYLRIGSAYVVPIGEKDVSMPDDSNLGTSYILVWGDNT